MDPKKRYRRGVDRSMAELELDSSVTVTVDAIGDDNNWRIVPANQGGESVEDPIIID